MATRAELRNLVEEQGFKCAGTSIDLEPETASLDHMIPVSRGGSDDIENLCVVHHEVNRAKGQMTWNEFVSMCHAVAMANENPMDAWWEASSRRRQFAGR
jgi:CRISPR/Cas system Type II protein with McrA/HNH and RuvC-like nuclease domain